MNINGYIKSFGHWSFLEVPFNYVDGLIFAELSYINLDLLINNKKGIVDLKRLTEQDLDKEEVYYGSVDASYNKTMLKLMKNSERFKDIYISDIVSKFSNADANQFYAFTIHFNNNKNIYVSYRGTDISLIGWKEDFLMTYKDATLGQLQSVSYINEVLNKYNSRFYIGGHSKGGNLAFYAGLNMNQKYNSRLINVYSYDGPGFKNGIHHFSNYEHVNSRLIKFKTHRDIIGCFFTDLDDSLIVFSNGILLGGHDPFFWQVDPKTGEFIYRKKIIKFSQKNNKKLALWLDGLTDQDKALAVDTIFKVFGNNTTIYDLFKNFGNIVIHIKDALKDYSKDERKRLKDIIFTLLEYLLSTRHLKHFYHKVVKRLRKEESNAEEN